MSIEIIKNDWVGHEITKILIIKAELPIKKIGIRE